jgi:hypothetical protein
MLLWPNYESVKPGVRLGKEDLVSVTQMGLAGLLQGYPDWLRVT